MADQVGSIAPFGDVALAALGRPNQYQQYTPLPIIAATDAATFIPGSRILSDVARAFDPYQRKPTTVGQAFGSYVPLPGASESTRERFRGLPKTIQVPLEGNVKRSDGVSKPGRETTDILVRNYKKDVLLGLMAGLYESRIDPDVAEAFNLRDAQNAKSAKKKAKAEESSKEALKKKAEN